MMNQFDPKIKITMLILFLILFIGLVSYVATLYIGQYQTTSPKKYASPTSSPTIEPTKTNPLKETENPFNTNYQNPFSSTGSGSYKNPFQ